MTDDTQTPKVGVFDRFASWVATLVSRAPFFAFCVLLVVFWALEGLTRVLISGSWAAFLDDKYQLQINTTTTIVTFWLVSLLQNTQARSDAATQQKLNALLHAALDQMELEQRNGRTDDRFDEDVHRLRKAIGLEDEVGTKKEKD